MAINKNDYLDGDGNYDLKKELVDDLIDKVSALEQNASLMQSGAVIVPKLTANQNVNVTVNFPRPFSSIQSVNATINSNFPSMKRFITVGNVSNNSFQLNVYAEDNADNLAVYWIANGY